MNTNRNLHSTKVLTEFARDLDEEEDTSILSQFVNKISNTLNAYSTTTTSPSTIEPPLSTTAPVVTASSSIQINKEPLISTSKINNNELSKAASGSMDSPNTSQSRRAQISVLEKVCIPNFIP